MNYGLVSKYLGYFSFALGAMMAPAIAWAGYFRETEALIAFVLAVASSGALGAVLALAGRGSPDTMYQREALALVALSWFVAAAVGGLPFLYSGELGPIDSFFESMSGFTTTGSTVLQDFEAMPKSLLFWRSMMQWLGGVGIVVLFIAVLPYLGAGGKQLFKSETSGPDPHGLSPRIKDTASTLYKIYGGFTIVMVIALMIAGMDFYDALCHTMSTISTGGFSPKQESIAAFSGTEVNVLAVELIVIFFMLLGGTSFALFFVMLRKDWKAPLKDSEWKAYMAIAFAGFVIVTLNLATGLGPSGQAASMTAGETARAGAFQVVSIMTGTGFVTADFDQWPALSRMLLFMLMFAGGCAGSTAGGIKIVRLVILAKIAYWRVENTFRPKTVRAVRINNHVVDDDMRKSIHSFFVIYVAWFVLGSLFMAALGLPFESAMSSVAATLNNIGPGLELVGATKDYAHIPGVGKLFLCLCMALGRLELFSICVLFVPSFWSRR